jgi:diacylglycerol O-acyltransferase / wax synthase
MKASENFHERGTMSTLSLMDLAFFIAESDASPKHVAGLQICKKPAKARADFVKGIYDAYLTFDEVAPPFNRVIHFSLTALPSWKTVAHVDLSQHVFFHKLPARQNDRAALYELVSSLHAPLLDRSRPLWEVHVIDNVSEGRFALYQKMHHAYADGVTMSRWGSESYQDAPDDLDLTPVWTIDHTRSGVKRKKGNQELALSLWAQITANSKRAFGIGRLGAMLMLEGVKLTKNAISLPFMAPRGTPLTGLATPGRQLATAAVSMKRISALGKKTRSTVNHIALTCLDGALHRYLKDEGVTLTKPITIQMPVNLRKEGEKAAGNKIGIILVDLSAPTDDPYVRLRNIGYSLRNVRQMIDSVAPEAIETYTILTGIFGQIAEMLKLSNTITPMGNTTVSNVPGPKAHLYVKGARIEEMHPVSTLPPTHLMNITLFSYAGDLYFGLIATDALPNLQRLAGYVDEAFDELEKCVAQIGG